MNRHRFANSMTVPTGFALIALIPVGACISPSSKIKGDNAAIDNRLVSLDTDAVAKITSTIDAAFAKVTASLTTNSTLEDRSNRPVTTSQPAIASGEGATAKTSTDIKDQKQSGAGNVAIAIGGSAAGLGGVATVLIWLRHLRKTQEHQRKEETKRMHLFGDTLLDMAELSHNGDDDKEQVDDSDTSTTQ